MSVFSKVKLPQNIHLPSPAFVIKAYLLFASLENTSVLSTAKQNEDTKKTTKLLQKKKLSEAISLELTRYFADTYILLVL